MSIPQSFFGSVSLRKNRMTRPQPNPKSKTLSHAENLPTFSSKILLNKIYMSRALAAPYLLTTRLLEVGRAPPAYQARSPSRWRFSGNPQCSARTRTHHSRRRRAGLAFHSPSIRGCSQAESGIGSSRTALQYSMPSLEPSSSQRLLYASLTRER